MVNWYEKIEALNNIQKVNKKSFKENLGYKLSATWSWFLPDIFNTRLR